MGQRQIVSHNTIDRISGSTLPQGGLFSSEEYYFYKDTGIYFLLDIRDNQVEPKLSALWPFFEHIGLGGDASIGKGSYKFIEEDFSGFSNNPDVKKTLFFFLFE